MALLLLILTGIMLGWIVSVVMRTEEARTILEQIGLGVLIAVIVGLFTNSGTFLGGLSLVAFGAASAATIGVLAIYHLIKRRSTSE